jgi:hypothetical protein
MIFPAKSFARRDREIVKALGVLVHEKLEVVGQVQNCCPAELAMKAVGAQWSQTTLKHRNPEVYLAFAIAFPGQRDRFTCIVLPAWRTTIPKFEWQPCNALEISA